LLTNKQTNNRQYYPTGNQRYNLYESGVGFVQTQIYGVWTDLQVTAPFSANYFVSQVDNIADQSNVVLCSTSLLSWGGTPSVGDMTFMILSKNTAYFQLFSCPSGTCKVEVWQSSSFVDATQVSISSTLYIVSSMITSTYRMFDSISLLEGNLIAVSFGSFDFSLCFIFFLVSLLTFYV
jgi:hypothetical protein